LRTLVAAIAFLAVTGAAGYRPGPAPLVPGEDTQVTVYMERTRVGATNWSYVKRAGAQWARSSRIQLVFVKRCPSSYYCVKVYQVRSTRQQAGWATLNYDPRTNTA
jgi:hypothetical protein